jgi:hypothetical protein
MTNGLVKNNSDHMGHDVSSCFFGVEYIQSCTTKKKLNDGTAMVIITVLSTEKYGRSLYFLTDEPVYFLRLLDLLRRNKI